jgi:hypothetical protein
VHCLYKGNACRPHRPPRHTSYNRHVRKLATILVLVMFASLNAFDGICCPDGCTHNQAASSSPSGGSTEGACVLCAGGLQGPVLEDLAPVDLIRSDVGRVAAADPHDVPPDPPEHPPRS